MTLTIAMPPDLETRLRSEAARVGLDESEFVRVTLEARLGGAQQTAGTSAAEADLLQKIAAGPLPEVWREYRSLLEKRREGTLPEHELRRLLAVSDQIEQWNAERLAYLTDLANLRGITLPEVMKQLGIRPHDA